MINVVVISGLLRNKGIIKEFKDQKGITQESINFELECPRGEGKCDFFTCQAYGKYIALILDSDIGTKLVCKGKLRASKTNGTELKCEIIEELK